MSSLSEEEKWQIENWLSVPGEPKFFRIYRLDWKATRNLFDYIKISDLLLGSQGPTQHSPEANLKFQLPFFIAFKYLNWKFIAGKTCENIVKI